MNPRIVVLSGGVGGARLVGGLAKVVGTDRLTVIVNTGDDFTHLGLRVSPDVDTITYTLAGIGDDERGWGLAGESFHALGALERLMAPTWFALGDRDLATHLVRTEALGRGESLTDVTARIAGALGVKVPILPMADTPRGTLVQTRDHGQVPFQDWLVRLEAPAVTGVKFQGSKTPAPGVLRAIERADAVVLAPSNPYTSIDPIITLEGVRKAIRQKPVIAVSPIVRGRAVKGPLAEMIRAIAGRNPSAQAIVDHYDGLVGTLVVETGDAVANVEAYETEIVMRTPEDRSRLAREVLALAASMSR